MGALKKLLILVQRPQHKSPQLPLGHQTQIILALFLKNLAILRNATLIGGLN